jgi:hypothetical protein
MAPFLNLGVMTVLEDFRHGVATKLDWARVLRVLQ